MIKEENLVLELTQENSIESSVQDCLPYIPQTTGLYTTLAYSKWLCVCLKTTMYIIYSIMSFLPELFTIFHYGTWSCDSVTCDITLIPNSSSKNRIDQKEEKEKKEANKIESNLCISNNLPVLVIIHLPSSDRLVY